MSEIEQIKAELEEVDVLADDAIRIATSVKQRVEEIAAKVEAIGNPPDVRPTLRPPSGIDSSGESDVTSALQAWLDSVPDDSIIEFAPGSVYRIEGNPRERAAGIGEALTLRDKRNVVFDGQGAILLQEESYPYGFNEGLIEVESGALEGEVVTWREPVRDNRTRGHILISQCEDVVLTGLVLQGAHSADQPAYIKAIEGQHGFDVIASSSVEIYSCVVENIHGDWLYCGPLARKGLDPLWTKGVHFHDNVCRRNGRQGVAFTGCDDVLIEDNEFGIVARTVFDIEPNGPKGGCTRLVIRRNTVEGIAGAGHFLALHGKVGIIGDIEVSDNFVHGKLRVSSNNRGPRRWNVRILRNVSDHPVGSPIPLMTLNLIDGVEVRENVQPMNESREMTGVRLFDCTDWEIGGNDFPGAAKEFEIVEAS